MKQHIIDKAASVIREITDNPVHFLILAACAFSLAFCIVEADHMVCEIAKVQVAARYVGN
jgi:hypothetical protein